jgi:hypothetical protein
MRTFGFLCRLSAVAAISLFICAGPARATDPARQCRRDAASDRRDCNSVCSDNYQAALLLCGAPCPQGCADTRKSCRGPVQTQLQSDIKACNATRTAAIKICRAQWTLDHSFDKENCIDAAQIAAFICRDDAREAAFPVLNQCNEDYQACVRACP